MLSCLKAKNTINVPQDNKMKMSINKILGLMYYINNAYHYNLLHQFIDCNMMKHEPELSKQIVARGRRWT